MARDSWRRYTEARVISSSIMYHLFLCRVVREGLIAGDNPSYQRARARDGVYRDKLPFTLTFTPMVYLECPINPVP